MKITIEVIPHNKQRYKTCGDWIFDDAGNLSIKVSDMGNNDYTFLVGIHEAVEAYLCMKRGIKEQDINDFDIAYEANRQEGDESEPGDHWLAPYRKEHFFATNIERLISEQLEVDWAAYDKAVMSL